MNGESILGPVMGGSGVCPYCKESHSNVAYHAACQCEKRPGAKPLPEDISKCLDGATAAMTESFYKDVAKDGLMRRILPARDTLEIVIDNLVSSILKEDDASGSAIVHQATAILDLLSLCPGWKPWCPEAKQVVDDMEAMVEKTRSPAKTEQQG